MKNINKAEKNEIVIVLAGEAGQGVQSIGVLLTRAFRQEGYHVFSAQEFMSRIRGGSNSTMLRVGILPVCAWTDHNDLSVVFDEKAYAHLKNRITSNTFVLGEDIQDSSAGNFTSVPLAKTAKEAGGAIFINTVVAGIIWGILGGRQEIIEDAVKRHFTGKSTEIIDKNLVAVRSGLSIGTDLKSSGQITLSLATQNKPKQTLHLSGTEAFALGAVAGGCNFVSAYPMSPSSAVFSYLAKHGSKFGIIVEQAEDEISAANMVIGAWYAGARGMTVTSGGGFALMTEALSLSGISETPMVILLAQRPGPATGLATRTEQGDLNLALYAGHGEFPRILLAPGNPEQAFHLAEKAFNLADKFQVPVIVLTDQYLMDLSCDTENIILSHEEQETAIVQTVSGYHRYTITDNGISPRGIPGWGKGLVGADSHEHTENGHITESPDMRVMMVDKRFRKLATLTEKAAPPEWIGPHDAHNLVICWGSTLEITREALSGLNRKDIAIMHFQQIFPLHEESRRHLQQAGCLILLEGNSTGQFGRFIRQQWGVEWKHSILKYNGLQFSVEEVRTALLNILEQEKQK